MMSNPNKKWNLSEAAKFVIGEELLQKTDEHVEIVQESEQYKKSRSNKQLMGSSKIYDIFPFWKKALSKIFGKTLKRNQDIENKVVFLGALFSFIVKPDWPLTFNMCRFNRPSVHFLKMEMGYLQRHFLEIQFRIRGRYFWTKINLFYWWTWNKKLFENRIGRSPFLIYKH